MILVGAQIGSSCTSTESTCLRGVVVKVGSPVSEGEPSRALAPAGVTNKAAKNKTAANTTLAKV